jgi:hypothetical protein
MLMDIRKRNLDIGLDDGMVTPTLLPTVAECGDTTPVSYPVPSLDVLTQHGFVVRLTVEPHEWEAGAIRAVAYPDAEQRPKRIDIGAHLSLLMDYIKRDALRRYGPQSETLDKPADAR